MRTAVSKYLSELDNFDIMTEDGYRQWTLTARNLGKGLRDELSFAAVTLQQILRVTPVATARSGVLSQGDDAKAYARKVRAYLSRAAQSSEYAAGQIQGAWSVFENGFLVPSRTKPQGMRLSGSTRRGA